METKKYYFTWKELQEILFREIKQSLPEGQYYFTCNLSDSNCIVLEVSKELSTEEKG